MFLPFAYESLIANFLGSPLFMVVSEHDDRPNYFLIESESLLLSLESF